jgi:hypothetical protein
MGGKREKINNEIVKLYNCVLRSKLPNPNSLITNLAHPLSVILIPVASNKQDAQDFSRRPP